MPKYFYVCTSFGQKFWTNEDGYLIDVLRTAQWIGSEYWPYTRREARLRPERTILQFDATTLKFVKVVK